MRNEFFPRMTKHIPAENVIKSEIIVQYVLFSADFQHSIKQFGDQVKWQIVEKPNESNSVQVVAKKRHFLEEELHHYKSRDKFGDSFLEAGLPDDYGQKDDNDVIPVTGGVHVVVVVDVGWSCY